LKVLRTFLGALDPALTLIKDTIAVRHSTKVPFLMLALLVAIYACQTAIPLSGDLPVHAPQTLTVGTAFTVTVGPVTVSDGTQVGLVMMGKHGPRVYHSSFSHGVAQFTIPGEHTLQPGFFAFVAASQNARGETGMRLEPYSPVDHDIKLGML